MAGTHESSIEQTAPDLLTIKEAGAVMRVGRSKAYDLARLYLATGVVDGLPVRRIGNQLRAPRLLLEDWLGVPITAPFHPRMLAMRDEYQRCGAALCARIVAGDTDAIATGRRCSQPRNGSSGSSKRSWRRCTDQTSQYVTDNERRANDGLGRVLDAIRATGDLCTAVDDPDQYVAPVSA